MMSDALQKQALNRLTAKYGQGEARSLLRILREDLGKQRRGDANLPSSFDDAYAEAVDRLVTGEPVQYVVQNAHFFGLDFFVDDRVLIPRPETEELVDMVRNDLRGKSSLDFLDIGTGSGCIAITLAKLLEGNSFLAIDKSTAALEVAMLNASSLAAKVEFKVVDFLNTDAWPELGTFDVICSNPPYVARSEQPVMGESTLAFEPEMALFPVGEDHLIFYRMIAEFGVRALRRGGKLFLELNEYCALEAAELFRQDAYYEIQIHKDMSGKSRILTASRRGQKILE